MAIVMLDKLFTLRHIDFNYHYHVCLDRNYAQTHLEENSRHRLDNRGTLSGGPRLCAHPLATDDTGTAGMGKFQLETSAEFGWDKESEHGTRTTSNYQTLNVALTAGLLDSLDLVLSYPYTWQHIEVNNTVTTDNSGLNDLTLDLKWRILELGPASLAIKPSITFPHRQSRP